MAIIIYLVTVLMERTTSDSAKGVTTTVALHNWVLYISAQSRQS